MNRRLIGLVVAVVLALVATGLLVQYVRTADERARVEEQLAEVFVAQGDIIPGTSADEAIGQGLITTSEVPARAVPSGAIGDLSQITGQIVTVPIYDGEIIVAQRFGQTVAQSTGLLQVPEGTQAVTVEANVVSGLAGYIQPGNTVSIVGSLAVPLGAFDDDEVLQDTTVEAGGAAAFQTRYLVQNATVLAIGRRAVQESDEEDPRHIFTLAMSPEDIERLVFTTQRGNLWFTLVPEPDEDGEVEVFDTPGRRISDAQE